MAMATAMAFLPGATASAAGLPGSSAGVTGAGSDVLASADADGTALSYVVNVRPGHGPSAQVKKAIAAAGGTIVTSYDQI
ncbi:MAG: peptidase S8, partial [Streptomyces sp.]|nr:peptidase S8 [Streptomyces sp.]